MTRLASRSVGAKQLVNEALRRLDNLRYNSTTGEWNYRIEPEGTPQTIDWKRWLGPAPNRLFSAERYFRFRKYWDYSGGIATDLFYHGLAPLVYAMGAQFPIAVSACGGIYAQKDREAPDTYSTVIEYPNFYIDMSGSMANAAANRHHRTAICAEPRVRFAVRPWATRSR